VKAARRQADPVGRLHRRQHDLEAQVDKVHVGHGDDDVAHDDNALVEDTIEDLAQGDLLRVRRRGQVHRREALM
jgi:hypothetical protein